MSFPNTAPWRMSALCVTSSRGVPGALPLFTLRIQMMPKRQRSEPMAWSWTVVGSGLTSLSQRDLTPQPLESTWADPHTVEVEAVVAAEAVAVVVVAEVAVGVVPVVHDVIPVTLTAGMSAGTREEAMIAMTTGNATDHTEEGLHHRTTEVLTGLGPDRGLILPVVTECHRQAKTLRLSKRRRKCLTGMIDFRTAVFS